MKPGQFVGVLRTTYVNKDFIRNHACPLDAVRFGYITSDGRLKTVPDNFLSDGGSIPRIFQNIIRRDELMPAFIIHDRDYAIQDISRKQADLDLSEAIYTLTCGYYTFKRTLIYLGVRSIFGKMAWNFHKTKERKAEIDRIKELYPTQQIKQCKTCRKHCK